MPQYLAPGVYVEEIPGPEVIQGVGTQTAGFIGPCRFGPTSGRPELLTSLLDFQRIYGDWTDLEFADTGDSTNYIALGVKGFFDEGGTSLYVCRTFNFTGSPTPSDPSNWPDYASAEVVPPASPQPSPSLTLRARFPGLAGQMAVTFTLQVGRNALIPSGGVNNLTRVHEYELVYVVSGSPAQEALYVVRRSTATGAWNLQGNGGLPLDSATEVYPLTVSVDVQFPSLNAQGLPAYGPSQNVGVFGFDPRAAGTGISTVLTANPPTRSQALTVPVALEGVDGLGGTSASDDDIPGLLAEALLGPDIIATALESNVALSKRQFTVTLADGTDGNAPFDQIYQGNPDGFTDYQGSNHYQPNPVQLTQNGLLAFQSVDDISIVAAPGAATGWTTPPATDLGTAINDQVISHCETMLYRVAAVDTPPGLLPADALDYRNNRSSNYAALYYPWITISSPVDGTPLSVPPAAYMAGIWARSDNNYGVIKAPANEVVRSATDFELRINKAQQELLNPDGVNCLRFFPGAGFLVWGARTISDDPEWKYLSIRRYFCYLEKSIDEGTQWVVFEVNGPALWDRVRHTIEGFLLDEWKSGALLGATPDQAYFVKCDASTMTQDDLDNGRLICLIGVAAAKPAEFVIFRIGQITASANS
jgi:phage tail sheath protein FI